MGIQPRDTKLPFRFKHLSHLFHPRPELSSRGTTLQSLAAHTTAPYLI